MDLLKPLIALLAIVNPIGVVPFFIHFTLTFTPEQRRRTIRISAFTAFLVIAVSAVAGLKVIEFFGISLASFQVGGGTVEGSELNGCWGTCHVDLRTMKDAKDDKKTKYIAGADLASGKFMDLIQYRSGTGLPPVSPSTERSSVV